MQFHHVGVINHNRICLIHHSLLVIPADNEITFSVGRSTGELRANGTLDRETISRYLITIDVSY